MSRRMLVLLAAASMVAASCGSKLTHDELLAADGFGARGGSGGQVELDDDASATRGPATGAMPGDDGPASPGATVAAGQGEADPGAGSEGGETATPTGEAAAPEGGNGGATDVGVTEDSITLGLITTLTGPVPGLFRGAAVGAQACAARANASGGLFGRQLRIEVGDDQLNENQVRAQAERLAPSAFAFVGSFSLYDGAMVAPMEAHGVPDIGTAMQPGRFDSPLNWSTHPLPPGWPTGPLEHLKQQHPDAGQAVGFLGSENAPTQNAGIKAAINEVGLNIVYDQTFSAATQDFTAHVFRMRTAGVRWLVVTGDAATYARILQSADQQDLDLDVFNPVANAYDPAYLDLAGDLTEGTVIYANHVMYAGEDASAVPEVSEFTTWMSRIDPQQTLDVFALYGWTSCLLFIDAATAVGPQLTREALREHLAGVTEYDGHGLVAPANPAGKEPPLCYVLLQMRGGSWQRVDTPARDFRCDGTYVRL